MNMFALTTTPLGTVGILAGWYKRHRMDDLNPYGYVHCVLGVFATLEDLRAFAAAADPYLQPSSPVRTIAELADVAWLCRRTRRENLVVCSDPRFSSAPYVCNRRELPAMWGNTFASSSVRREEFYRAHRSFDEVLYNRLRATGDVE